MPASAFPDPLVVDVPPEDWSSATVDPAFAVVLAEDEELVAVDSKVYVPVSQLPFWLAVAESDDWLSPFDASGPLVAVQVSVTVEPPVRPCVEYEPENKLPASVVVSWAETVAVANRVELWLSVRSVTVAVDPVVCDQEYVPVAAFPDTPVDVEPLAFEVEWIEEPERSRSLRTVSTNEELRLAEPSPVSCSMEEETPAAVVPLPVRVELPAASVRDSSIV